MSLDSSLVEKSIRSVFVGNIPYDITEEKLKEIFSQVGPVMSFRMMTDRATGKPKGYGFCEFRDTDTAMSAMRNLNGLEIGGRSLRVDNACSEKNRMEMQTMLQGPVFENAHGNEVEPTQAPEAITKAVASLPPEQMFELMRQMKLCIQSNPDEARTMLLQNPQLAYALLQAQVVMRIVDPQKAAALLHRTQPPLQVLTPQSGLNNNSANTASQMLSEQNESVGYAGPNTGAPPLKPSIASFAESADMNQQFAQMNHQVQLPPNHAQPTNVQQAPPMIPAANQHAMMSQVTHPRMQMLQRPPGGQGVSNTAASTMMTNVPPPAHGMGGALVNRPMGVSGAQMSQLPGTGVPPPSQPQASMNAARAPPGCMNSAPPTRNLIGTSGDMDMRHVTSVRPPAPSSFSSSMQMMSRPTTDVDMRSVPVTLGFEPNLRQQSVTQDYDARQGANTNYPPGPSSTFSRDFATTSTPSAQTSGAGMKQSEPIVTTSAQRQPMSFSISRPPTRMSQVDNVSRKGEQTETHQPHAERDTSIDSTLSSTLAGGDQEKAALIMQVLQLSHEQICALPPEQRQSVMVLKQQIAAAKHQAYGGH